MTKKNNFQSPFNDLERSKATRVTRSRATRAGKYDRKTITLPPQQIEFIAQEAEKHGIGILAFYRWLIDVALLEYEKGVVPIPPSQVVHETETKHWSSEG